MQIAASHSLPVDPVSASVLVPNNEWQLMVAPQQGWVPDWRDPMLATGEDAPHALPRHCCGGPLHAPRQLLPPFATPADAAAVPLERSCHRQRPRGAAGVCNARQPPHAAVAAQGDEGT